MSLDIDDSRRRDLPLVALLAAAAVALRFVAISYRGSYLGWDESMYLLLGKNLLSGRDYNLYGLPNITFPALVPLIGGAVWRLTGSVRWALSAPSAVFGGLAVIPVYLLARRVFSRKAGLVAAVIFAGFRPLLLFSPFCWYKLRLYAGSEQIFIFIAAWVLYFFWRAWQEKSVLYASAAGLACGIGFEARQESLVLFGAMWVWLAAAWLLRERGAAKKLVFCLAAAAMFFALGSAPFFLYARSVTGHFLLGPHVSHNIVVRNAFLKVYFHNQWADFLGLYLNLNPEATQFHSSYYGVSAYHLQLYTDYSNTNIFSKLLTGVDLFSLKYWLSDLVFVLPLYLVPFAAIGLVIRPLEDWLIRAGFFAAALVPAAMIACMLLVLPRYNVYTSVVFVVLAAAGVVKVAESVAGFLRLRGTAAALAIAVLIAAAGTWQALHFNAATRRNPERAISFNRLINAIPDARERHIERMIPDVARELERLAPGTTKVISHDPQFPLVAGDEWIPLPMDSFERIIAFARHQQAGLVILKPSDLGLRFFDFEASLAAGDLVEVASRRVYDGEEVAILRVVPGQ